MKNIYLSTILVGLTCCGCAHQKAGDVRMQPTQLASDYAKQRPGRRVNIENAIPLEQAINDFNTAYPDPSPLTVAEVVAAIRTIKDIHPDINPWVCEQYQRVADEKMLLPGFYLSRITSSTSGGRHYAVDWRDLTFDLLPSHNRPSDFKAYGFNYRIRARFISVQ